MFGYIGNFLSVNLDFLNDVGFYFERNMNDKNT